MEGCEGEVDGKRADVIRACSVSSRARARRSASCSVPSSSVFVATRVSSIFARISNTFCFSFLSFSYQVLQAN